VSGQIIVGKDRELRSIPDDTFVNSMKHLPEHMAKRLAFMSRDHHTVRDFVVREMPRQSRPLSSRQIANVTALDLSHVSTILAELEKNLFFLVRNSEGNVSWAFPVTTDRTAHRLSFSDGDRIYGA
jgi:hypothetical protein